MKATEITFAVKQSTGNYGSVSASITYTLDEKDTIKEAFEIARREAQEECELDPAWIRKNEKGKSL